MKAIHNLKPIYNQKSEVLILGSMPSVVSREKQFYYAHPQNRFWTIMENIFNVKLDTTPKKEQFLLDNHLALWDVIKSCTITGSSDASIKNVEVNNLEEILNNSSIKAIFCTGTKAYNLYQKYFHFTIPVYLLPSPSSANASYSLEKLIASYQIITKYLTKVN